MSLNEKFYKQTTMPDLVSKEQTPALPKKIGPYAIEGLLAKGGMSLLYLGTHPETKETLAIKVLSPAYVTHPEAVARFLKEAQIIGLASHPNIVKLYGQGEWEGGLYIAMEFIRGISLTQFIIQHSFSLKRSIDIVLQVARALMHLHTNGVIHRDLKPENILITEDGEIKVIDFGISQLHGEGQVRASRAQVLGTPSYMSPEQREDPSKVTFASDIYSLGVIAYELAVAKLSFGVINITLLPKGLQKIIGKALAVSLTERYRDIVDFMNDLSEYLRSDELEKERPGSDQLIEMVETLNKASSALSPSAPPDWEELEIGVARHRGAEEMSSYFDFFRFPDGSFGIVLAEPRNAGIETPIYTAALRGAVRTFIHERKPSPKEPFRLMPFISSLNELICADTLKQPFALAFLILDPFREQLAYVSCGLGRLIHLPEGNTIPRFLAVQGALLGAQMPGDFTETVDNWNVGDTLFLHSLESFFPQAQEKRIMLDTELSLAIGENTFYSTERQADAILKRIAALHAIAEQRMPKVMISIRRLS